MNKWLVYWRIANSLAGLTRGNLYARGLPPPQTPVYKTYAALIPQSQGGQTRQGYINATLLWDRLDFLQAKTLNGIVEAGITAGSLWLTVDKGNGTGLANAFIDISGIPHPLVLEPTSQSQGQIFENVQLFVTNITVLADPSTCYTT